MVYLSGESVIEIWKNKTKENNPGSSCSGYVCTTIVKCTGTKQTVGGCIASMNSYSHIACAGYSGLK